MIIFDNRNSWKNFNTGFNVLLLGLWVFYVGQDIIHHTLFSVGGVVDVVFLAHRAWCAWKWYLYLRDDDNNDDDDKGTPIPVWRRVLLGA